MVLRLIEMFGRLLGRLLGFFLGLYLFIFPRRVGKIDTQGLTSHLNAQHATERERFIELGNVAGNDPETTRAQRADEWLREVAQKAEAMGIMMRRSAASTDGVRGCA